MTAIVKKPESKKLQDIRAALEDFRDYRITIEEFLPRISQRAVFMLNPTDTYMRGMQKFTAPLRPAVPVTWQHAQDAHRCWKRKGDSVKQLRDWAFILTMNDDYSIRRSKGQV